MITLQRFYWAVAIMGIGFILFFWGSTPQQARDYTPLRTQAPADITDAEASAAADIADDDELAPWQSELSYPGPRVWFEPAQPLPGDTLRVVFASGISSSEYARISWSHNMVPLAQLANQRQIILDAKLYGKGHLVQALVQAPGWQEELSARVFNQPPVVQKFDRPVQSGPRYVVHVRGTDPEGDELWLSLPANSPGIDVSGLQVWIDPLSITQPRSVPIALTDGDQETVFLLHLKPEQFADYQPPPKVESIRDQSQRQRERDRDREADRDLGAHKIVTDN